MCAPEMPAPGTPPRPSRCFRRTGGEGGLFLQAEDKVHRQPVLLHRNEQWSSGLWNLPACPATPPGLLEGQPGRAQSPERPPRPLWTSRDILPPTSPESPRAEDRPRRLTRRPRIARAVCDGQGRLSGRLGAPSRAAATPQLTTHNSQLATRNSQLTTNNSQRHMHTYIRSQPHAHTATAPE